MALEQSLRMVLAPPHPAARPFLIGGGVAALLGLILLGSWLFWLGVIFVAFCLYFFRDPERVPPDRPGLVIAPADGHVVSVMPAVPPVELGLGEAPRWRVAIFLSVLDVHVNRMPVDGTVTRVAYHHGKFLSANVDKASDENERNALAIALAGRAGPRGGADRRHGRPAHPVRRQGRAIPWWPANASASSASAAAPTSTCRSA